MILRKGNMWGSKADLICVTGNATIRKDGCLVMGRGAALECQNIYPGINRRFGLKIKDHFRRYGDSTPYGVLLDHEASSKSAIGLFQVKWHFRGDADLDLIHHSVECLAEIATSYEIRGKLGSNMLIAVNMPGVGYGHLHRFQVMPIIEKLPGNVEVWEYA